ncbi:hypothetical protein ABIF03_009239 [Bradyrhizobium elkanii]
MQRAAPDALGDLRIVLLGLGHRPLRKDQRIAVKLSVQLRNPAQHRLGDLRGLRLLAANELGNLGDGFVVQ